jgi:glycosyltransferase involved in cell wall biosynthesis
MARKKKIDILHLNTFFQHASIVRRYNPDARIVLHMHDETMSLLPPELVRPHLKNIDCLVGVSDFISNRFKARFPEYADKCITIYNGVDPDRFYPLSPAGSRHSPRRILYVGRVSPEKGIHILLSAFASVADKFPDCQLDIVGAPGLLPYVYHLGLTSDLPAIGLKRFYGDSLLEKVRYQILQKDTGYLTELRRMIDPGIAQRIHFHGSLPNKELLKLYNSSSMLVFPSVWNEPFGMPITEAMACGLPVVSTDSGGIPELIQDDQTGLLVKRDDVHSLSAAMTRLLGDASLGIKLGRSARSNVLSSLTFDQAATDLIACYERLLAS